MVHLLTHRLSAFDLLARYAASHRDQRNLHTHFIGIPMMVFALGILLARPTLVFGELHLTPAWVVWVMAASWYLTRGEWMLGCMVSLCTAALLAAAHPLGQWSTVAWLGWGLGFLGLSGLFQFIGHYYEGRKADFFDDLPGLLVGPMFVTAQGLFALGWKPQLLGAIERRAGPVVLHDLASRA